jgi:hypothetical protein
MSTKLGCPFRSLPVVAQLVRADTQDARATTRDSGESVSAISRLRRAWMVTDEEVARRPAPAEILAR